MLENLLSKPYDRDQAFEEEDRFAKALSSCRGELVEGAGANK